MWTTIIALLAIIALAMILARIIGGLGRFVGLVFGLFRRRSAAPVAPAPTPPATLSPAPALSVGTPATPVSAGTTARFPGKDSEQLKKLGRTAEEELEAEIAASGH